LTQVDGKFDRTLHLFLFSLSEPVVKWWVIALLSSVSIPWILKKTMRDRIHLVAIPEVHNKDVRFNSETFVVFNRALSRTVGARRIESTDYAKAAATSYNMGLA
jgi:hypothetical protein